MALEPGAADTFHTPEPGLRTITYVVAVLATGNATAGASAAPGPKATGTTALPLGLVRTTEGAVPAPVTAMSSNGAAPAVATSATRVRPATEATDRGLTTNGERSQLPVPTDASGVPPHG